MVFGYIRWRNDGSTDEALVVYPPQWSELHLSVHRPTWCRPALGSWGGRWKPCRLSRHLQPCFIGVIPHLNVFTQSYLWCLQVLSQNSEAHNRVVLFYMQLLTHLLEDVSAAADLAQQLLIGD